MDTFVIPPPVDMDVVTIIENLNRSGPTQTTPPLAAHQVDLPLFSVHSSDRPSSGELPCPGDCLDASDDQLDSPPLFDADDQQILDSHSAQIPINLDIMSRILNDE
jgi:hypothetical protein